MPLLDRSGLAADAWLRGAVGDAAEALIVPVEALYAALADRPARLGIDLPNTFDVATLAPLQDRIDLIAIAFPTFTDGRGFSLARELRQQGFEGRLRASGHLIPDQFAFALECGFDEVEIDEARLARQPVEQWLAALGSISAAYQEVEGRTSIFARRRAAA